MADIERLEATLAWAKANPKQHDQDTWGSQTPCGTTMCFAGAAVNMSDEYEMVWRHAWGASGELKVDSCIRKKTGHRYHIPDAAARLLKLNSEEKSALFYEADTVEDLELMVKNIANGVHVLEGFDA